MFFILSKTIYHLIMPTGLLLVMSLLALWRKKWRRKLLILIAVLLLLSTNRWLANEAMRAWEAPPKAYEEIGTYEVGVVLSGMRKTDKKPLDQIHFSDGSDRLWQTIFLYRAGKIKHILISGANYIDWRGQVDTSGNELRAALLQCGIPDSAILLEPMSVNTAQNAQFSAEVLRREFPEGTRCLLITSAFHMRRSALCFEKQGVNFDTFSADFKSGDYPDGVPPEHFFPSSEAIRNFEILGKELIGIVVYWLRGYL